jgi:hypothetical protein
LRAAAFLFFRSTSPALGTRFFVILVSIEFIPEQKELKQIPPSGLIREYYFFTKLCGLLPLQGE